MSKKYTYEYVKDYINSTGNELLSTEYLGNKYKLKIRCKCGEIFYTSFTDFKRKDKKAKRQCDYCSGVKVREKICPICGKNFKPIKKTQVFCSKKCRAENDKKREYVKCDYCGKEFEKLHSQVKRSVHHFCSKECKSKWQEDNLYGENNPNYGNTGVITGEKHPRWNPNLTQEERERGRKIEGYSEFIKNVFERDNYTCQVTGIRGGDLVVHHLYSYNKYRCLRTAIENGVTVSKEIHKEFHNIYGYGNNTEEQWNEFIENRNREAS